MKVNLERQINNIMVFKDTQKKSKEVKELIKAIGYSITHQEFIPEGKQIVSDRATDTLRNMRVKVTNRSTLGAAKCYPLKKVCILNFANAERPGGGVNYGMPTQEESICRCSTLHDCISDSKMKQQFYRPHLLLGAAYNDDIIYTPDVVVFKTDSRKPEMMSEGLWYKLNVITCVAPDLNNPIKKLSLSREQLLQLHYKRALRILEVAYAKGNEVLVLGAFGCGDFKNPPEVVAEAYQKALKEFEGKFDVVEFAVYDPKKVGRNYWAFKEMLGEK